MYEDGNIKSSINLEQFKNAKNPLFKNIPFLILVDLEISFLEIMENIFDFYVDYIVNSLEKIISLLSIYKNSRGTENYEKIKRVICILKMKNHVEFNLEVYIKEKEKILMLKEQCLKQNMEILIWLNKLKDFFIEKVKLFESKSCSSKP